MDYTRPFDVHGVKVSIHNKRVIRIYHDKEEITDEHKQQFDNVAQYLIDEYFIETPKCKVEIQYPDK